MDFFQKGFRLFIHDYFGVYCPWSWQRAKKYRLDNMRLFLGSQGQQHDRLGHITAKDCDDPDKQEEIARYTFISRQKHWVKGLLHYLISPIPGVLILIGIIVGGVVGSRNTRVL
jgi:hypothetical protein